MAEFFDMGGYGAYIWSCYAIVLGSMALMLVSSLRKSREAAKEAEALRALSPRRRRKGGSS